MEASFEMKVDKLMVKGAKRGQNMITKTKINLKMMKKKMKKMI